MPIAVGYNCVIIWVLYDERILYRMPVNVPRLWLKVILRIWKTEPSLCVSSGIHAHHRKEMYMYM